MTTWIRPHISFPQPRKSPVGILPAPTTVAQKSISISQGDVVTQLCEIPCGGSEWHITLAPAAHASLLFYYPKKSRGAAHVRTYIEIGQNAICDIVQVALTEEIVELVTHVALQGEGASCTLTGVLHGSNEAKQVTAIILDHLAPHTTADVLYRGVYEGDSRAVVSGLIRIAQLAQQTKSYFRDDILLHDSAITDSLPTLEIQANDVKASHGSTTTTITPDQLLYVQSRGMSAGLARKLITDGFLRGAFGRVPKNLQTHFARVIPA